SQGRLPRESGGCSSSDRCLPTQCHEGLAQGTSPARMVSMYALTEQQFATTIVSHILRTRQVVTNCTGHLFERDKTHIHRLELFRATIAPDSFLPLQKTRFYELD